MILSKIQNTNNDQKLIVGCNIFNTNEMKNVCVPGMHYTVNIDFEDLTMGYVENILTRVYVYGEKIVVILNIENNGDTIIDVGKKIFKFTDSVSVRKLVDNSTFATYDNSVVKDRFKEINNLK